MRRPFRSIECKLAKAGGASCRRQSAGESADHAGMVFADAIRSLRG